MFGGLHELSVKSTEPEEIILNPEEVPNWLTGEEGASIGEIRNGNFITKSMDESLVSYKNFWPTLLNLSACVSISVS